jgi:hypothetical protein
LLRDIRRNDFAAARSAGLGVCPSFLGNAAAVEQISEIGNVFHGVVVSNGGIELAIFR